MHENYYIPQSSSLKYARVREDLKNFKHLSLGYLLPFFKVLIELSKFSVG